MNPRVKEVYPNSDYTLSLVFENGEEGRFDVSPYLDRGIFSQLKDRTVFNSVKPFLGSIQWENGLDLCPDTLYLDSSRVRDALADPLVSQDDGRATHPRKAPAPA